MPSELLKFLQICSGEETNSSTSWMSWGWLNLQQIFIFLVNYSFIYFLLFLFIFFNSIVPIIYYVFLCWIVEDKQKINTVSRVHDCACICVNSSMFFSMCLCTRESWQSGSVGFGFDGRACVLCGCSVPSGTGAPQDRSSTSLRELVDEFLLYIFRTNPRLLILSEKTVIYRLYLQWWPKLLEH